MCRADHPNVQQKKLRGWDSTKIDSSDSLVPCAHMCVAYRVYGSVPSLITTEWPPLTAESCATEGSLSTEPDTAGWITHCRFWHHKMDLSPLNLTAQDGPVTTVPNATVFATHWRVWCHTMDISSKSLTRQDEPLQGQSNTIGWTSYRRVRHRRMDHSAQILVPHDGQLTKESDTKGGAYHQRIRHQTALSPGSEEVEIFVLYSYTAG